MKKKLLFVIYLFPLFSFAQQTETLYLSGTGLNNEKEWRFYCTDGMNRNKWSKIKVPSQWELQGFGTYTYGRWYKEGLKNPSMEQGLYEHIFQVPSGWKNKQISIVFEGVMTDTEVKINGQSAGDVHQGGFYRFSYDITDKLKVGAKNKLEVKVSKQSANKSVNAAERRGDWWLYGGIYRPVYLEAKPQIHIERVALNAQADGQLSADIFTSPLPDHYSLSTTIIPLKGNSHFESQISPLTSGISFQTVTTKWSGISTWTPETPNLYSLKLELRNEKNEVVHIYTQRIGFRTIEFRRQDGIYVNGVKIVMKGINRHSFYPDGGRTTNREISLMDVKLIKEMNMNAVRSHYPPDTHFLDICDSLGLFYLDELAGWQNAYDTPTGEKLVKELVVRDVNHPCIVLWDNGNEGGWNTRIDKFFAQYDPQKRHVIHPWADFDGIDTHHYPAYQTGIARFTNGYNVFMPTEFMHGLYDQGLGAGLEDFWNKYTDSPLFAGGFMWAYLDEAVKRSDKKGILDSDNFNAPDGIVGPYRQKEASFYSVREIWSPVQVKKMMITSSFNGQISVSNKYLYTRFNQCNMKYRLYAISSPLQKASKDLLEEGAVHLPDLEPGDVGKAIMPVSQNFFYADVLELEAYDSEGNSICNWTWPVKLAGKYTNHELRKVDQSGRASFVQQDSTISLTGKNVVVRFNTKSGLIIDVKNKNGNLSFTNGPVPVGMKARVKGFKIRQEGENAILTMFYTGGIDSIRWEMTPAGLLHMNALMLDRASGGGGFDDSFAEENITNFGLTFSYPEANVKGMKWFGRGPYRVWKNRIPGTNYGLWEKAYNNTITGENYETLVYPEFKGYHANLYWASMITKESDFSVFSESDGLFFRVLTPEEPKGRQDGINTMPDFPAGDLSFLYEIPAIRDFKPTSQQGPQSQPGMIRIKKGDDGISMKLWFDFR